MVRRFFLFAVIAVSLAGCKPPGGTFAAQTAATTLATTLFAAPNNVQTLSFTAGGARDPKPYALANFLYAKRWLACKASQPGPFASQTICTFETVGRSYAHANGWTAARPAGGCAQCETWTVPVATAKLQHVTRVAASGKTQATATYEYAVIPNEFGTQLADWMAKNPVAWCGPIPSARGGWSKPRSGTAEFVRAGQGWQLAQPAAGFAATFDDPAATGAVAERACSA